MLMQSAVSGQNSALDMDVELMTHDLKELEFGTSSPLPKELYFNLEHGTWEISMNRRSKNIKN